MDDARAALATSSLDPIIGDSKLWWINRDQARFKPAWTARIDSAEPVGVSAISCFEVAWLTHHGRIELPVPEDEWFDKALEGSGITLLAITPDNDLVIKIGRGLDIHQWPRSWFELGAHDMGLRRCLETSLDIFRQ